MRRENFEHLSLLIQPVLVVLIYLYFFLAKLCLNKPGKMSKIEFWNHSCISLLPIIFLYVFPFKFSTTFVFDL